MSGIDLTTGARNFAPEVLPVLTVNKIKTLKDWYSLAWAGKEVAHDPAWQLICQVNEKTLGEVLDLLYEVGENSPVAEAAQEVVAVAQEVVKRTHKISFKKALVIGIGCTIVVVVIKKRKENKKKA